MFFLDVHHNQITNLGIIHGSANVKLWDNHLMCVDTLHVRRELLHSRPSQVRLDTFADSERPVIKV